MRIIIILLLSIISIQAKCQYKLKFRINGLKDTSIYLARYLGDRLYYADTAESKNGIVEFSNDNYQGGVFAVICPGPKYFEFIMADKTVEMETSLDAFIPNMKVKKSIENIVFYDYIQFINSKKQEAEILKKQNNTEELKKLDAKVKDYQKKLVAENSNLLISKILNMSIEPEIPEKYSNNDTLRYKYYVSHYWDNIDVTDKRIVHSPVYHNKLKFFFKKLLIQHPDTICKYATNLINQFETGTDLFKYTVHFITYNFETSKVMGMDAVFVCMAQNYYCPRDSTLAFWLKDEKLKEICERASALDPLLMGKKAPRIVLADTTEQKWINFYNLPQKYNLLMFWDPDCGHCKKEIPKIQKLYKELKEKNIDLEIIAIGTSLENKEWKEFVKEKNMNWINISDFPDANENPSKYMYEMRVTDIKSLNFRKTYDIFSTPQIYLLDKDKVIIGKKLDALTLGRLIQMRENVELNTVKELEKIIEEKEKKEKEKKVEGKSK